MTIAARTAFASLILVASPAGAEILAHGRYACALSGQGACSDDGPDSICLGDRVKRGKPNVFLKLDFGRSRADLNGIVGSIHRDDETGVTRLHWDDLEILGSPMIGLINTRNRAIANLRFQGSTASFSCRRTD